MKNAEARSTFRPVWVGVFGSLLALLALVGWRLAGRQNEPASGPAKVTPPSQAATPAMIAAANQARNRKIDLSLEILDQDGKPVSGATVQMETGLWVGGPEDYRRPNFKPWRVSSRQLAADERGRVSYQTDAATLRVVAIVAPGIRDHPWDKNDLCASSAVDLSRPKQADDAPIPLAHRVLVWRFPENAEVRRFRELECSVERAGAVRFTGLWEKYLLIAKKVATPESAAAAAWPLELRHLSWDAKSATGEAQLRARNGTVRVFTRNAEQKTAPSESGETVSFRTSGTEEFAARFFYASTDGRKALCGDLSIRNLEGEMRIRVGEVHAMELPGKE